MRDDARGAAGDILADGGDMGARMRAHDWSSNPLGPPSTWSLPLRTLVSVMLGSRQPMFVAWGERRILLYNDAYAPLLGLRNAEALGRPFFDVWVDIVDIVEPIMTRAYAGESTHMDNLRLLTHRNGYPEEAYFAFSYTPVRGEDGEVAGVFCACTEITHQVRAEASLREHEEQLRGIIEGAQDYAIVTGDQSGTVLSWSPGAQAIFGWKAEEIIGREFDLVFTPEDRENGVPARELATAAREGCANDERWHLRKDGSRVFMNGSARPLFGPDGALRGFLKVARDETDRRLGAQRLAESEARWRSLFERMLEGFFVGEPIRDAQGRVHDFRLMEVNPAFGALTGLQVPEVIGKTMRAAVPGIQDDLVEAYGRVIETGEPVRFDVLIPALENRWYEVRARRTEDLRLAVLFLEITGRKRAEAARHESQEALRGITDSVDQMIWSTRPDGFHDYYNQRWYDYTGVPAGSTDGDAWNGMFHPDDQVAAWATWAHSLETGEPYRIEYRLRHRSGQYRWVLGRAQPVRNERGEITRWFGTCTDIQEIVEAREVLARSREKLEQEVAERTRERDRIWNMSEDLFAVMGYDGYLKSINPAWSRLLAYDEATLLSMHVSEIAHPDDHEMVLDIVARLRRGEAVQTFEDRLRAADGRYLTIAWTASSAGEVFYAVGRDVTQERERGEQLRQAQKMEAVGQLTGGVAHDFNNLLQVVLGNLEIVQRNLPEDAARLHRSTENAMQGAQRAAMLTQRLLAFSRRQPLEPKPVEPNTLVVGMSELLTRALGETVELECVLAEDLWRVEVDANQLESAILNLAVNARDAMPEGGKLTIETSNTNLDESYVQKNVEATPGPYVVICVTDTGSGMEKEAAARAFEPFFTTKEVGKGTGLGLSQVYGFVKQSGGHVKIYSEPGQGTTVKIYMPRYTGAAREETQARATTAPEGVETVLVVEDDENVRSYTVEVLRELGYRVLEASDGPGALRLLQAPDSQADLLFTDVVLPGGLNGEQLALQARDRRPGLKVLFTTGYARNAIAHQGRLEPGVQLITKPFTYAELAARVREVLDAREA